MNYYFEYYYKPTHQKTGHKPYRYVCSDKDEFETAMHLAVSMGYTVIESGVVTKNKIF